ncbi:MAG: hypothetical protein AAFW01_12305, partial [Pseudomonadota bacterium]
AQHKLGLVLLWSESEALDRVPRALDWLAEAASEGHAMSAVVLGKLHEEGLYGVPRDLCTARSWYRKGADLGLAPPDDVMMRLTAKIGQNPPCR